MLYLYIIWLLQDIICIIIGYIKIPSASTWYKEDLLECLVVPIPNKVNDPNSNNALLPLGTPCTYNTITHAYIFVHLHLPNVFIIYSD